MIRCRLTPSLERLEESRPRGRQAGNWPGGRRAGRELEALVKGLVPVIVNPIPGQEERNADHLLEQGAAIRCNNLPVLAWKIDGLLDDPARLARMRHNGRRLARPNGAREIAACYSEELQCAADAASPSQWIGGVRISEQDAGGTASSRVRRCQSCRQASVGRRQRLARRPRDGPRGKECGSVDQRRERCGSQPTRPLGACLAVQAIWRVGRRAG